MRKFKPGARVRVEIDAVIVRQARKDNPYWYICQFSDGHEETVNLARINWLADEPVLTLDTDGSIQIISNRLSREGWFHLIEKLQGLAAMLDATGDDEGSAACMATCEAIVSDNVSDLKRDC